MFMMVLKKEMDPSMGASTENSAIKEVENILKN